MYQFPDTSFHMIRPVVLLSCLPSVNAIAIGLGMVLCKVRIIKDKNQEFVHAS